MDFTVREISDEENEINHENSGNGRDLRPEFSHYRDEGCEHADACLECPFERCLYDEPWGRQRWLKGMRKREIRRLAAAGWSARELAMLFGVSQRTVQRAMKPGAVEAIDDNGNRKTGDYNQENGI